MKPISKPLSLDAYYFRILLEQQGPSLGLWRAAEVAALREQHYETPILDLGCGDGLVTSLVLPQVDIGLDPNRKALEQAARRGIYTRIEALPAEKAPLPPGSVGAVISNSVLEHIPQVDDVLKASARLLRPGGRLVFTTPSEAFSRWLAFPIQPYAERRNRQFEHINLWSLAEWEAHLNRAGLEVEQVRPYLRRPLVALWDLLELLQQVWIAHRRLVKILWQRIPANTLDCMAQRAARLDLSAPEPGGGRLIVAQKC